MSIPNHLEPFHELSPTSPTDLDLPKTTGHRHRTLRTHSTGFYTQSHVSVARQQLSIASGITSFHRLPLSNFRYFLTLFSKFFSSFLHSTFLLSVFSRYLAFDEVYHQIRAAIPNNPTLWSSIITLYFFLFWREKNRKSLLTFDLNNYRFITFFEVSFQRTYVYFIKVNWQLKRKY